MNSLLSGTLLFGLGNMLPSVVSFFMLPIYARYLVPADYGIIAAMQLMQTILGIVFSLALNRAIFRLYHDYDDKQKLISTLFFALSIIASVILILLFLLRGSLQSLFVNVPFHPYFLFAIISAYFMTFSYIPLAYLIIQQKAKTFFITTASRFLLETGLQIYFVVILQNGAAGQLFVGVISGLIYLPVYFWLIKPSLVFTLNWSVFRQSLKFSMPMIPSLLAAWAINLSDRFFIERSLALSDVGIYAFGYKLASLILVLSGAFFMAYNPIFYRLANQADQVKAKNSLKCYHSLYVQGIMVLTYAIASFAQEIVAVIGTAQYLEAHTLVPYMLFSCFINQTSGLFNLSIYQAKKSAVMMWIVVAAGVISLAGNSILVPRYGLYGALATLNISAIILWLLGYYYANKYFFVAWEWRRIRSLGFACLLAFALGQTTSTGIVEVDLGLKAVYTVLLLILFGYLNEMGKFKNAIQTELARRWGKITCQKLH